MSVIAMKRQHSRGLDAAREQAEKIAQDLSSQFGVTYHWDDSKLRVKGAGAKGHMIVTADTLDLKLELSFVLRPFKRRIEQEMINYLDAFCQS
jgi:putative polyhydroxyalkanoate system protein